jgi:hypothetical protein
MSSEEFETDLPVAAIVEHVAQTPKGTSTIQNFKEVAETEELVKRQDAEAAIAKERSRKYDEGFFEGRQSREKEILNKIEGMKQDVSGSRLHSADVKEALTKLRDELEEEVE